MTPGRGGQRVSQCTPPRPAFTNASVGRPAGRPVSPSPSRRTPREQESSGASRTTASSLRLDYACAYRYKLLLAARAGFRPAGLRRQSSPAVFDRAESSAPDARSSPNLRLPSRLAAVPLSAGPRIRPLRAPAGVFRGGDRGSGARGLSLPPPGHARSAHPAAVAALESFPGLDPQALSERSPDPRRSSRVLPPRPLQDRSVAV